MALWRRKAWFTYHENHGQRAYYFAPDNRAPSPYKRQVEVTAILDIADDGSLAGVELVHGPIRGNREEPLPPPYETV